MKSDLDLKQELYTDQIIPIYLLEDKLKANFVSIQRRFKEAEQKALQQDKRILQLQKSKSRSSANEIEKIVSQKLKQVSLAIDPSTIRKQVMAQVEVKFKQMKLQLPAQIRRQSQSLLSTELISIRRIINESKGKSSEGQTLHTKVDEYEGQKQLKIIHQIRQQIAEVREKVSGLSEEMEDQKLIIANQFQSHINNLQSYTYKEQSYNQETQNKQSLGQTGNIDQIEDQLRELNNKILYMVPRLEYETENKKSKQKINNMSEELLLVSKQLQNTGELHEMIVKINNNFDHYERKYDDIKSSLLKKEEVDNLILDSEIKTKISLQKIEQGVKKRIDSLEKAKPETKQKQIDEINDRVLQLQRLNNYDQYMESIQKVLDKHYLEEPPNPKKTLYLDYVNHLEKKVQGLAKDLKTMNQRMDVQTEGTRLLQVSKTDMEEVWKAIMILQSIIEAKPDLQSSRKKLWSQQKFNQTSKQDNKTPIKGSETVYIRKTDTHRAGGFGQKVSSSKNIKHLIDQKPEKLERIRQKRDLIRLPQIPQEIKDEEQKSI